MKKENKIDKNKITKRKVNWDVVNEVRRGENEGNVGSVESDYKYEEKRNPRINKLLFNNKCSTDKSNICDKLNTYFINVGPNLSDQLPKHDNPNPMKCIKSSFPNSFMFRSNHVHEEHNLIKSLRNQKLTIGVPIKCVKLACDCICEAITDLYNHSIAQGIVPDILKISKVTPIDKGGDTMDPTNYRHISTLSDKQ